MQKLLLALVRVSGALLVWGMMTALASNVPLVTGRMVEVRI